MKTPFTLLLFLFLTFTSRAQEFPYPFSVYNEPFTYLEEATDLTAGELWDDPEFVVPIGFDWTFFGNTISEITLLAPGSQMIGELSGEMTVDLYYPYVADIMNASTEEYVSPITYSLEGTPGDLIFKIEWRNVGFYGEFQQFGSFGNTTNFQMWIYQNGNMLEYRYGDNTIKSPDDIHFFGGPLVLIGDEVSIDGNTWTGLWTIAGDPDNPTVTPMPENIDNLDESYILSGEPASGTVYRFGEEALNVRETNATDVVLWPNPAQDWLRILSTAPSNYTIYNTVGQAVRSGQLINDQTDLNIADLESGIYIFTTPEGISERFMVK